MFDLKSFREDNLKMTQVEFAEMIGLRQDTISRMEKNPGQIPYDDLLNIATKCGVTIDELVKFEKPKPKPLDLDNTWRAPDFTKKTIVDYIEDYFSARKDEIGEKYLSIISELRENVNKSISKPRVAIVGRSDVGKSALINSILGTDKMPTAWTPTTSISVYIKHLADRPKYIEEDVWIFRNTVGQDKGWDDKKLNDEKYCRTWKLAGGSADILRTYGTRQGDDFEKNEAGAAVVFVDSSILNNCDIIDLPGFGTGDRIEDDMMTLKAKQTADVLIYMSIANGFMRSEDIEYIKESIYSLSILENKSENDIKPLSNLFILASQAQTVNAGNKTSLNKILDSGCERLTRTMPANFWDSKQAVSGHQYGSVEIRSRFFTYTTDIEDLRSDFNTDICKILELLPRIINEKAKKYMKEYAQAIGIDIGKEMDQYNAIISDKEKYELLLAEILKNEPKRANDNQNRRMDLVAEMKKMRTESISQFADSYNKVITVDNIIAVIKAQGFKKKKEDNQALASYINSQVQTSLQDILQNKSEQLNDKINAFISAYQKSIDNTNMPNIELSAPPFNATRAFASGLAGLATFGALSFWASTLGNLGSYILIAKGVSILSALGISVGGTAAAVSAIAAIGGPIVLGIALAIVAAIAVFAIISGGWEKSVAKKIVATYDEKDCLMNFKKVIEDFWKDTEIAFNTSADSLENEWKSYVKNLEDMVSNYDIADIQRRLDIARDFQYFFVHIPL